MSATGRPLLRASGLEGQRGERPLFKGLNFTLCPGEVVWLRGRNGQGKTTLLRILAGLAEPAAGQIEVLGADRRGRTDWREHLMYIAHANALKEDLTATEALRFLAALHGQTLSRANIIDAFNRIGVAHRARAPVRTLSQGQRRRVSLSRLALPQTPELWLLDEPFDALDDMGIQALNALIAAHAARGGATILTSHQALSLTSPAPRVLLLDDYAVQAS